jgi:DNA polymerase-1
MAQPKIAYTLGLPPRDTRRDEIVALDFEIFEQGTTKMHRPNGSLACLSINAGGQNYIVQTVEDVREAVRRVRKSTLAMQHGLYDLRYFQKFGVDVSALRIWDVEIGEHVMYSGYYNSYGLAAMARRHFGLLLDKSVREGFDQPHPLSPRELLYAATDAQVTADLARKQIGEMEEDELRIYWDIEYPSYMAILQMGGVRVDTQKWLDIADRYEKQAAQLEKKLGFNVMAPKQVQEAVRKLLKISLPDTQKETLEAYQNFELIQMILAAKQARKNASTYGRGWLETNVAEDGLVHADWIQCGTETDRWACKTPNLQNIPVRHSPEYRTAFIPTEKGEVIMSKDADQQEPRCLAHISKDRRLNEALAAKIKTHLMVARDVFHDPTITKEDPRYREGKDINLGMAYGLSAYGLAHKLGRPVAQVEATIAEYHRIYSGVAEYQRQRVAQAYSLGFVRGATGQKIFVNPHTHQAGRNAMNAPIQNTAAHITKLAVARLLALTKEAGLPFGLIMGVHDEHVSSVPKRLVKRYDKVAEQAWQEAADYCIPGTPFATETVIGPTWSKKD